MLIFSVISTILLSLVRTTMALLSRSKSFLREPTTWLVSHQKMLRLTDELLALASFSFSISLVWLLVLSGPKQVITLAVTGVSLLYCNIAWIGIVSLLGNLVYPVNGLKTLENGNYLTTFLQIYSRMHLADLALGILTLSLAGLSIELPIQLMGYASGFFQIIFTYYSRSIKAKSYIFSVSIWTIWMVIFFLIYH